MQKFDTIFWHQINLSVLHNILVSVKQPQNNVIQHLMVMHDQNLVENKIHYHQNDMIQKIHHHLMKHDHKFVHNYHVIQSPIKLKLTIHRRFHLIQYHLF